MNREGETSDEQHSAATQSDRTRINAPIAKRDRSRVCRDAANAALVVIYAELARRQKAGESIPTIDFGAL